MSTRDDRVSRPDPTGQGPGRDGPRRHRPGAADRDTVTERDRTGPVGRDGTDSLPDGRPARRAKTSVAAAFALALGVAAFLLVVTVVLSPIGVLLALVGIVLGIVGIRAAGKPARTGKGVAITGLVLSVLALLLVVAAAIGVTTFLNDPAMVAQLQQQIDQLRGQLPSLPTMPGSGP